MAKSLPRNAAPLSSLTAVGLGFALMGRDTGASPLQALLHGTPRECSATGRHMGTQGEITCRSQPWHPRVVTRCFVLAELLVVLLVLAVFASVVGLSTDAAREKARQAVCVDHLRHLTSAWRLYAEDHDGAVPPVSEKVHNTGKSWEDVAAWPTLMQAYIDDPALEGVKPRSPAIALTAGGVLSCPGLRAGVGSHTPHYGMNHVAVQREPGGWERLPDMPQPARTLIFADSRGWYVIGPTWGLQNIVFRHSGGANGGFADGHVDWLPERELAESAKDWHGKAPWQPKSGVAATDIRGKQP